MSKFSQLKFVRVTEYEDFKHIPRYLFNQMRYKEFDVDRVYDYAPQFLSSPQTWFYVLVDSDNLVRGLLWATTELVQNVLMINMLSVDPGYQGGAIRTATDFLFKEIEKTDLKPKIFWIQRRWKYLVRRLGWKSTGRMMIEMEK
jgi:hypothetical protein